MEEKQIDSMKICDHKYKVKFTEIIKKIFSIISEYNFICTHCGHKINRTIKINLFIHSIPSLLVLTYNGTFAKYIIKDVLLIILHVLICISIYSLSHLLINTICVVFAWISINKSIAKKNK